MQKNNILSRGEFLGYIGAAALGLVGCNKGGSSRRAGLGPQVDNLDIEYLRNGRHGVEYTIHGNEATAWLKGEFNEENQHEGNEHNGFLPGPTNVFRYEITERENTFLATAYNLTRTRARSFPTHEFRVAERQDSLEMIEQKLADGEAAYLSGERVPELRLDHTTIFRPDFIIESSPERFSYFHVFDINPDERFLEQARATEDLLNDYTNNADGTVRNLVIYPLPEENIERVVDEFVRKGYRRSLD